MNKLLNGFYSHGFGNVAGYHNKLLYKSNAVALFPPTTVYTIIQRRGVIFHLLRDLLGKRTVLFYIEAE
jgi:hypothetical protein